MKTAGVPKVSVIVPVCNAADYTRGCLEELQLRGGLPADELEIIVVDNGSTDHTPQVLADRAKAGDAAPDGAPRAAFRVIRNAENQGFAIAVNQGLQAARAPLVCVLNNDTLLTEGWLAPMVQLLDRDPSIGLVGPCTSYAKGRQQIELTPKGRPLASPMKPMKEGEMRELAAAWCGQEHGRIEDVSFLSGFCFVARRADLLPIGGLAVAYGKGTFEDDELCRRLRRSGLRLVIARDAYVHHFGNRTFRALGIDLKAQQAENWKLFAARHGDDAGLLARVAASQERWRDVLKLALAGMKQSARDLDALWLAAQATARLGAASGALRLLERYLARCPFDPAARALKQECEGPSECAGDKRNELRGRLPIPV